MSLTKASYSMITGAVANVLDYGADLTGATDSTAAIQAAINTGKDVFLPTGAYLVDPAVGLVVKNGTTIFGEGRANSILVAKSNGATLAQLVSYTQGSIIKRSFNPFGTNAYVSLVCLRDFAIVLNHPTASITTSGIQIGIDLRNITRSSVERVWVGNIAPTDQTIYVKAAPTGGYQSQGYGIVVGGLSSSNTAYAGGEVNNIVECNVVGAYKLITIDDGDLSPLSGAHATSVVRCDLQSGQSLLVQEGIYSANTVFESNTVQNIVKQTGNSNPSFVLRMSGYNGYINSGYIEASTNVDYLLYLGPNSHNNRVTMNYYASTTGTGYISDAGTKNTINYYESTATPPAVNCFGAPIYLYNSNYKLPYKSVWIQFHWSGSAMVVDGSSGNVSVARNSAGDYTLTYTQNFPSANYSISVASSSDPSGHGFTYDVISFSASNLRIATFSQNGATTTQIDPLYVWVTLAV
jgi:hypothetical protein